MGLHGLLSEAPQAGNLADTIGQTSLEALRRLVCRDPSEQFTADPNVKPVHERVIFVPAVTRSFNRSIAGKKWSVRRRQLPLTSAQDRTVQSSQGKTFRNAVFGDMGNMNTERDAYWSAMYVLLSRATRMEDLLVFRCPPKSFFDQGPPAYLRAFLSELNASDGPAATALAEGSKLLSELGWEV